MNGKELLGYTIRIGGEYPYMDHYFIRAGLGNGRMSVGVGVDWSLLKDNDAKLDYAFVFENPAGSAHIFTYAFTFYIIIIWRFTFRVRSCWHSVLIYTPICAGSDLF